MKKKIIGILVCMLLIAATVLPVTGTLNKTHLQEKTIVNTQQPPEPYITIPGNDGLLFDPTWQTTFIDGDTLIRAVDMSNQEDILLTIFEYSPDGEDWIEIGIDEYGGFEGTYLEGEGNGNNIKIGKEGWSVDWDVSELTEGTYYIKATMIDVNEQAGSYQKQVYYDPTPPLPEFASPQPYDIIEGIYDFEVVTEDSDVISYELGVWTIIPPLDYFEKDHLGTENQHNVGPNGTDGGNRYCVPTAIKNSLHRFVHYGDENLEPPLPWHPARNSPLNFTDGRYVVPEGGDGNLAMARMLSEELGTTPNGGTTSISGPINLFGTDYYFTDSITSGIRSYLEKRGVGCTNRNGYSVTTYGTIYKENNTRWQPLSSTVNYETYESELRKCEDVILDLHRWIAGADGKLGTTDDDIGGGHAVTGRSANACPNAGDDGIFGTEDDTNDVGLVDPWTGANVSSEWRNFNGFPGVRYGGGQWRLVSGMWSISPKQPNPDEYLVIGIDADPTGGWLVSWDTTTMQDGYYVVTATLMDSEGFAGRTNMVIKIQNFNSPPNKPNPPSGPTSGKINVEHTYTASTIDPDGDQISYLFDWGDGSDSGWTDPIASGETATASHTWTTKGTYQIKVKARDIPSFEESEWSEPLSISMPRNRAIPRPFLQFLQNHPNLFPILQHLLKP